MTAIRWVVPAILALWLAGCGGGGGGGGGDASGTGGPTAGGGSTTTSLIPAGPVIGTVLYADATTLRPLRVGAVWKYRGSTSSNAAGFVPQVYTGETTHAAGAGTGVVESETNPDNAGTDSSQVSVSNGVVTSVQAFDFTGVDEPVTITELRSPVRQGDQYIQFERHYDDSGVDVDGDRKPDALDIAMYTRVISKQMLTLKNLPAIEAVEVDTVLLLRLKFSSTGQYTPVGTATQKLWYAPGVGIVRRATEAPIGTDGALEFTDEQIVSWDGLGEGLGAMPTSLATVPAGSSTLAGVNLAGLLGQFAFDDHALVLTRLTSEAYTGGSVISKLDPRGNVLTAKAYPALAHDLNTRLAANDSGLFHLQADIGSSAAVVMTRFDGNGALVGAANGIALDLSGGRVDASVQGVQVAGDGSTLWILWLRFYRDTPTSSQLSNIVLRGFDPQGTPTTPEILLEASPSGAFVSGVSASSGRVIATWSSVVTGVGYVYRYTVVAAGATAAVPQELVGGSSSYDARPVGLLLDSGATFTWTEPFLSFGGPLAQTAGVTLNSSYGLVRSTTGSIDTELLPVVPRYRFAPQTVEQRLVVTAPIAGLLWPEDTSPQELSLIAAFDIGTQPLAATPVKSIRAPVTATAQLVFRDRVLLFSEEYEKLSTTLVWLR